MNAFLEHLMTEHRHALAQLALLEEASSRLAARGYDAADLDAVRRAVRFVNGDVRAHNEREETHLFPALEAAMPGPGPTVVMRHEHRTLWTALNALEPLAAAAGDASTPEDFASIREAASGIVQILRGHIAKEDAILFPMAERMLTPEQHGRLERVQRDVEAETTPESHV